VLDLGIAASWTYLHGLFVREAEAAVREFLAAYKKGDSVEMIVTGHRAWVRRQASVKLESKRYLLKSSGKIFAKIEWKDVQGCAHCASSSQSVSQQNPTGSKNNSISQNENTRFPVREQRL
jgi:hypothetical protein